MKGSRNKVFCIVIATFMLASCQSRQNDDEDKAYEFGFTIDGQQHRHESKDVRGIVQGEFGFITADGIYHVTVYATDENGDFHILSMRNVRISAPLDGSPLPPGARIEGNAGPKPQQPQQPAQIPPQKSTLAPIQNSPQLPVQSSTVKYNSYPFTTQPTIKPACAGCGYVTTAKPKPGEKFPGFQNLSKPQPNQNPGFNSPPNGIGDPNLNPYNPPINTGNPGFNPNPAGGNPNNPAINSGNPGFNNPNTNYGDNFNPNNPPINQGNPDFNNPNINPATGNFNLNIPNNPTTEYQQFPPFPASSETPLIPQNPGNPNGNPDFTQRDQGNPNIYNQIDERFQPNPGPNQQPPGPFSNIKVDEKQIQVPGNAPIPIKDKFPGMEPGLPAGITENDISDLLYKFNYTVGFHGHYERGTKSGAKIGGYFVNGRDGISRIVTYVADENGYRAKVKFIRLDLNSDDVPKEATEKTFGLKNFEFIWYPIN